MDRQEDRSTLPPIHPIHPIHPNPNPNPNQAAIRFIVPTRKRLRVDQLFRSFETSAAGGHGAGLYA